MQLCALVNRRLFLVLRHSFHLVDLKVVSNGEKRIRLRGGRAPESEMDEEEDELEGEGVDGEEEDEGIDDEEDGEGEDQFHSFIDERNPEI